MGYTFQIFLFGERVSFLQEEKMAIGFFLNPNRAGAFFVLCFFLSIFFVESKFWRNTLLLINLFLIIFSYSRGSMLALILGGIYYQVVKSDNILNILKFYFISVCSAIVSILVIIKWFPEQFKGILFKLTAFGSSNRFYLWESVLLDTTSSIRRFLFGSGPSTTSINGFSAHNSFINEFSNLGFLFDIYCFLFINSSI